VPPNISRRPQPCRLLLPLNLVGFDGAADMEIRLAEPLR